MGGTNSSLRAPESTGTICSTSTHKRALSTRCHHGVTDSPVGPGLPSPCPEPSVGFPIPPPAPLLSPRKSKPYTISCLHFSGWVSHNKVPSVCSWSAPEILRGCVGHRHTHILFSSLGMGTPELCTAKPSARSPMAMTTHLHYRSTACMGWLAASSSTTDMARRQKRENVM